MKRLHLILLLAFLMGLFACKDQKEESLKLSFSVQNTLDQPVQDALINVNGAELDSLIKSCSDDPSLILMSGEEQVPYQLSPCGKTLSFVTNLNAGEKKEYELIKSDKERKMPADLTQAELSIKKGGNWEDNEYIGGDFVNVEELRVPDEHTDHSYYIRYEGPGWESDKIGYRFYLDWRNATDIFGKKVDTTVLEKVGQDNFDSYHEPAPWGMDVLKVGESLGIGSIGYWNNGQANRVAETDSTYCSVYDGTVQSAVQTDYYGWKTEDFKSNLHSTLLIHTGTRLTKHHLKLEKQIDNLCTGIVKHPEGELIQPEEEGDGWTYLATFGEQSLFEDGDNLGMAVFYKTEDLMEITEDEHSHVVVLTPEDKSLSYYFMGAWEQEPNGIKTMDAFKSYLENKMKELNSKPKINIK